MAEMQRVPGYWMHETTGELRPAVEAYLLKQPMTDRQIAAMLAYLLQWIDAPGFRGSIVDVLRTQVKEIRTRQDIDRWMERADACGIDPL